MTQTRLKSPDMQPLYLILQQLPTQIGRTKRWEIYDSSVAKVVSLSVVVVDYSRKRAGGCPVTGEE